MNKEEIWKDIVGYENLYQVSNLGRIKSLPKFHKTNTTGYMQEEKILKQVVGIKTYMYVALYKNKIQKLKRVHCLVAEAFLNKNDFKYMPYEDKNKVDLTKLQVNHKDENKQNNCADNLEFCTHAYNQNYGTIQKNKIRPVLQYDLQNNFIREWKSMAEASRSLNIRTDYIFTCCIGKRKTYKDYIFKYKMQELEQGSDNK